jgi:hypothetical protein
VQIFKNLISEGFFLQSLAFFFQRLPIPVDHTPPRFLPE